MLLHYVYFWLYVVIHSLLCIFIGQFGYFADDGQGLWRLLLFLLNFLHFEHLFLGTDVLDK